MLGSVLAAPVPTVRVTATFFEERPGLGHSGRRSDTGVAAGGSNMATVRNRAPAP